MPRPATTYHMAPLAPVGGETQAWLVTGGTEPYVVAESDRGEWSCTCNDWQYRGRKYRPAICKHVMYISSQTNYTDDEVPF